MDASHEQNVEQKMKNQRKVLTVWYGFDSKAQTTTQINLKC